MTKVDRNNRSNKFEQFRASAHEIIFESQTTAGRRFDVILLILILASVIGVMIDSIPYYHKAYGEVLLVAEWIFTALFTIEYILRLLSVYKPVKYATSFFGIVDLLAILPTYISLFFTGAHVLIVIRALRLLRVFRILGMYKFVEDGGRILTALRTSSRKIIVFLLFVLSMVTILGTLLYLLESHINEGFNNIPQSIYWAIVTLTTVGYGDIAPITALGKFLAAIAMILGYAVIAVPTGIISTEMMREVNKMQSSISCPNCSAEGHYQTADFCYKCGHSLEEDRSE